MNERLAGGRPPLRKSSRATGQRGSRPAFLRRQTRHFLRAASRGRQAGGRSAALPL